MKKTRYIAIGSKNLKKEEYETKRVMLCNDFINERSIVGYTSAYEYFEKYDIPDDYRRLFIKYSGFKSSRKIEGTELITQYEFEVRKDTNEYLQSSSFVGGLKPYYTDQLESLSGAFSFHNGVVATADDVASFMQCLDELGKLDDYISAVGEFFNSLEKERLLNPPKSLIKNRKDIFKMKRSGN